jgi:hypothetical protein
MTFKSQLEDDLDVLFNTDEFAHLATYTDKDNVSTPNTPVLFSQDRGFDDDRWDVVIGEMAVIEVKNSDVPDPKPNETFALNGETWEIIRILSGDGFVWSLGCKKNIIPY